MSLFAVAVVAWLATAPAPATVVTEPKTGAVFETRLGDMSLLGVGLRTKTFLKFKVYALGLYVADTALAGPVAVYKGRTRKPAFYRELVTGDFEKAFVLKLARDLSAEQTQSTFRSHLPFADPALRERFVSYFGAQMSGQECLMHWRPGIGLVMTVNGVEHPPITDKAFADEVFAIWLRERPSEDPMRRQLVSRAEALLD
jgi:hypothetical protein